jgi:ABC-type nitrate/sulfonate/bicarbonate transport system substrate-binding protein
MKKLKTILCLLLTAIMILSLAACSGKKTDSDTNNTAGDEATDITFVLDWTPNTNHTGVYVAEALGYFADAGLNVSIVQPPDDGAEVLVASGKAQFGVSFQDTMAPALIGDDPLPITAVATIIQHNTSGIVSRAGEGMDTPKGLEGHKYATWDLDVEKATLKTVVEKDGGNFDNVILIPSTSTDEVSALESNSVDAIWIFYGWAGIACEVADLPIDYFAFADIDSVFDYYTPVIIANNDFLESDPDAAKAFLAACAKGYEYAIENPDDAAQILMDAVPELKDSSELVTKSQEYMADQYKAEVSQWGYMDPARWNAFYNWLNDNGLVSENIPENTGFTNDYLS